MAKKTQSLLLLLFLCSVAFGQNTLPADSLNLAIGTTITQDIPVEETSQIVPNQGFTLNTLLRGALGMAVLILISFLFSSNRKAIKWKTVGIGLSLQVLIAIGVLKVPFVQYIFDQVGNLFVNILEFTRAGSQFLFEGLVVDMDTFGYIFAFQVLPTIIFFSALTSVLYYLGVIQVVVKWMAWLLSKSLGISGAESL